MDIYLKNIGKIAECRIELNGITVIAGENSSGKSTIGKTLFAVYNTFYNYKNKVEAQKMNYVYNSMWDFDLSFMFFEKNPQNFIQKFVGISATDIATELMNIYKKDGKEAPRKTELAKIKKIANRIYKAINTDDEVILKQIFKRNLLAELGRNIGHVNSTEQESYIKFVIKGENAFEFLFIDEFEQFKYTNLIKDIVYIDDPFILDYIQDSQVYMFSDGHKKELLKKLKSGTNQDVLSEYLNTEKMKEIFSCLDRICNGRLVFDNGNCTYHSVKYKKDLDIVSLSTGMKNFVIIRTLLEKGAITENGVIILDEPEINLHPEWQLVLAEILVLLNKKFGLNILLNTHSPYFLEAIEAYSKKHNVSKKCKYYKTTNNEEIATVEDVTTCIDKIYKALATPFQKIEDIANE